MRRVLRSLGAIIVVVGYYVLSPIVYLVLALWCVLSPRGAETKRRAMLWVLHRSFRGLHWVTRLIRMQHYVPSKPEGLPEPCVLVANHPTLMDVTAILATVPNTVTVVKPSVYRRPLLGTVLRYAGFLMGPERSRAQLAQMMETAQKRLQEGHNVLIFPEGTRSPKEEVLPFSRAAFEIACRADVAVVPITIHCTPPWLSKEIPLYVIPRETAHMSLDFLAPINPADVDYKSRALRDATRHVILERITQSSASSSP